MYVFPILVIVLIHMSYKLKNYASHSCKLYQLCTLQTIPIIFCKLQSVILHTIIL